MGCTACAIWDERLSRLRLRRSPAQPGAARPDDAAGPLARRARSARASSRRRRRTRRSCSPSTTPTTSPPCARPSGDPTFSGYGLGTDDDPVFPGMYDASALIAGGSAQAARQVWSGDGRARGQHRRRSASRDARLRQRILRVQRRRARHQHAARRRRDEGRLRRHRRASRRRRAGRVLRRSARAHDQPAPGSAHAVPRYRPARPNSARGAAEGTSVNVALPPGTDDDGWLRAFRAVVPGAVRAFAPDVLVTQCGCDTHHEDPLANLELSVDGQRQAIAELHRLAHDVDRRQVAGVRRRRLRPGALRAAHLDAPARRGDRRAASIRRPRSRRSGRTTCASAARAATCPTRWAKDARRSRAVGARRRLAGSTARSARPAAPRSRCSAWTRTTRVTDAGPPTPTAATGRPTSSSPTAAPCTCARSVPSDADALVDVPRRPVDAHPLPALLLGLPAHPRPRPRTASPTSTTTIGSRSSRCSAARSSRSAGTSASAGTDEAEVAFVVADAHQGRGIGSVLLEHLAAAARESRRAALQCGRAGREHRDDAGVPRSRLRDEAAPRARRGDARVRGRRDRGDRDGDARARAAGRGALDPAAALPALGRGRRREQRRAARSATRCSRTCCAWASTGRCTRSTPRRGTSVACRRTARCSTCPTSSTSSWSPCRPRPSPRSSNSARRAACADWSCSAADSASAAPTRSARPAARRSARWSPKRARTACGWSARTASASSTPTATVRLNASLAPLPPLAGRAGFFAQSGALGVAVLGEAARRGIGVSTFVSAGSRADVSGNDLLQFWETDEHTDVVLMYLESFGNPRKFARLARRLGRTKPIVAVNSAAGTVVAGLETTSVAAARRDRARVVRAFRRDPGRHRRRPVRRRAAADLAAAARRLARGGCRQLDRARRPGEKRLCCRGIVARADRGRRRRRRAGRVRVRAAVRARRRRGRCGRRRVRPAAADRRAARRSRCALRRVAAAQRQAGAVDLPRFRGRARRARRRAANRRRRRAPSRPTPRPSEPCARWDARCGTRRGDDRPRRHRAGAADSTSTPRARSSRTVLRRRPDGRELAADEAGRLLGRMAGAVGRGAAGIGRGRDRRARRSVLRRARLVRDRRRCDRTARRSRVRAGAADDVPTPRSWSARRGRRRCSPATPARRRWTCSR